MAKKKSKILLTFTGVSALLEFASKRSAHIPYTNTSRKEPGILLVKDEGIYLMPSNTDGMEGKLRDPENRALLVYAQDPYNPDHRDTYSWDAGQIAMGGDDSANLLDLPEKKTDKAWPDSVEIEVTPKTFKVRWLN